jgi:hypothetical protein
MFREENWTFVHECKGSDLAAVATREEIEVTIFPDAAMADDRDGYPSSPVAWEGNAELRSPHDRPSFQSVAESVDEHVTSHHSASSTSPHRSNGESFSVNGHKSATLHQPWRDNTPVIAIERRDTISTMNSASPSLVEPGFDENILRALCDLDVRVSVSAT